MKVLITGANGFIGNYLYEFLLRRGIEAIGVSRKNVLNPYVICGDLSKRVPVDGSVDCIIHAAGQGPAPGVRMDAYIQNNVDCMQSIIEYAKLNQVKRIIYLSTVSMFGEVRSSVLNEDSDIINPGNYGLSKYISEQLLKECTDIKSVSLLLPGILGKTNAMPWLKSVALKMIRNEEVSYFNKGAQFNNLLHVEDLSKYIYYLLLNPIDSNFERLLLGSCEALPIENVLDLLKDKLKSQSSIQEVKDTKCHFYLDVSKAVHYGFTCSSIPDMLNKFVNDLKEKDDDRYQHSLDWKSKAVFNQSDVFIVDKALVETIKEKNVTGGGV